MNLLKLSRVAAIFVGVFFALAALGGGLLGLTLKHGTFIALACLSAGVSLSCFLWTRESRYEDRTKLNHALAAGFALTAGLALYANVAWALWALGVPVDIGTVRDGRMGEHYWLGPFTLLYAIACYTALHWPSNPQGKR